MIVYFSSTGNCEYAAKSIAAALNDTALPMRDAEEIKLAAGEKLGFVFPTYFWRLPSVVDEYMKNIKIECADRQPYIYFIATYGGTSGGTAFYMKRHLKRKGLKPSLMCGIKTVDNYTIWYNVNNREEIAQALELEDAQIKAITELIKSDAVGDKMKNKLPMIAVCGSATFYKLARRTKHFHAEDSCVGCGLCEKECPVGAIKIENGKPVWIKSHCTLCLGCLHSCPSFAIQYEDKTEKNGQYKHP